MAWKTRGAGGTGGSTWSGSDPFNYAVINDIDDDLRTWGGNVDAGTHDLTNLGALIGSLTAKRDGAVLGDLTLAQLIACGETDPNKRVVVAYDTTAGAGLIQAYHNGVAIKPLLLQPSGGTVGIGTTSPTISGTGKFHASGDTARIVDASRTPANSAAAGNDGEVCADSSYVYVHTGGSWRRAAVATF